VAIHVGPGRKHGRRWRWVTTHDQAIAAIVQGADMNTVSELTRQPDLARPAPFHGVATSAPQESALYTDAKGGLWAGVTSAVCLGTVAVGNLMLLAAALGQDTRIRLFPGVFVWVVGTGLAVGVIVTMALLAKHARADGNRAANKNGNKRNKGTRPRARVDRAALLWGAATAVAAGFVVAMLFGIARLSAAGTSLAWQPIVGLSLSVVAVAAFGGFYLASRRARVGFAASFILTFLVLLSYMLTLDGLAAVADGGSSGLGDDEFAAAAGAIRDLLTDFRGSVALIVGFYFGTDAAVSVVKILRTHADGNEIARLDRDLAVPVAGDPKER
jgi:hypothetical protein